MATGYTITSPTVQWVSAGAPHTVTVVASGGNFDGTEIFTGNDGLRGVWTPGTNCTVSSAAGTYQIVPTASAANFTAIYTSSASAQNVPMIFTNNKAWSNPSGYNIGVQAIRSSVRALAFSGGTGSTAGAGLAVPSGLGLIDNHGSYWNVNAGQLQASASVDLINGVCYAPEQIRDGEMWVKVSNWASAYSPLAFVVRWDETVGTGVIFSFSGGFPTLRVYTAGVQTASTGSATALSLTNGSDYWFRIVFTNDPANPTWTRFLMEVYASDKTTLVTSFINNTDFASGNYTVVNRKGRWGMTMNGGNPKITAFETYDLFDPGVVEINNSSQPAATYSTTNSRSASGGSGDAPTYQWYASTKAAMVLDSTTLVSGQTAATLSAWTPTFPEGTTFFVNRVASDGILSVSHFTRHKTVSRMGQSAIHGYRYRTLNLGFIGDSKTINNPGTGTIPTLVQTYLAQYGYLAVCNNQGKSGSTTAGWLPTDTTSETSPGDLSTNYFNTALAAFRSAGVTHVTIWLGHNDVRSSMSAATFKANLQAIIAALRAAGMAVFIPHLDPMFAPSGVVSTSWTDAMQDLGLTYNAAIDSLFNYTSIFPGDLYGNQNWQNFPEYMLDGIHQNTQQSTQAQNWAAAIAAALPNSRFGGSSSHRGSSSHLSHLSQV